MDQPLKEKIIHKSAKVAVIGLGYVGLPLALELANAGFHVFGIDISKEKIESLRRGHSYVLDVENREVEAVIHQKLWVGDDFSVLSNMDVINICVPTPLNEMKDPDISHIQAAVEEIIKYIKKETLIILISTTYPGTTEEFIVEKIEKEKNFTIGKDFFVCFSPERVDPGNRVFKTANTPRVIGGVTPICLELGISLYKTFIKEVIQVSSAKVAEMVKLLENTFRCVNIALVNEFAVMCDKMGINVWETIEAATSKPFGFMPFYPGPGIGGHCIPLDPIYLYWKAKKYNHDSRLIKLAGEINGNMPHYVVHQIIKILNTGGKTIQNAVIYLIGLAYKKDIDDPRESPAIEILKLLEKEGAEVIYHDPFLPSIQVESRTVYSQNLTRDNLAKADLVVITTDHSSVDYEWIVKHGKMVYDTKNATKNMDFEHVVLLGGYKKRSRDTKGRE
ncbi:nucleotide sugar dehydrogenase [Thermotalea metallivorans]|uniref:UDP-N-acetyl-D-glucosamine 6-dehydrogenase n=1 Tax=Thermotalea metallivorans TaxID=520762 RepID=A0A140L2B5_9FIRM|nr:nucleotide sugar dehydrogenase [Thermotalea metallivorans]KXG74690.1 UDP-N-acetyl-D-glucosamine 6-dehydrogenase [Thermotalea metallivorans]